MIRISFEFDVDDLTTGDSFFLEHLGSHRYLNSAPVADTEDAALDPAMVFEFARDAVPLLIPVVLLWLGKGKRLVLRDGERRLKLSNVPPQDVEKLLLEWVASGQTRGPSRRVGSVDDEVPQGVEFRPVNPALPAPSAPITESVDGEHETALLDVGGSSAEE